MCGRTLRRFLLCLSQIDNGLSCYPPWWPLLVHTIYLAEVQLCPQVYEIFLRIPQSSDPNQEYILEPPFPKEQNLDCL